MPRMRLFPAMSIALALGASGCVEAATHEKAMGDLTAAQRAGQLKDEQVRALQWQVAVVSQQFREAQARSEGLLRELHAQVQHLTVENAQLAERIEKEEEERVRLIAAAEQSLSAGRDGKPAAPLRPEDVRRLLLAVEARNALLLEHLGKIERSIAGGTGGQREPREPARSGQKPGGQVDVVDPWGFGSRK